MMEPAIRQSSAEIYAKYFTALRHWMLGRNFFSGLKALQLQRKAHAGTMRKDGVTPYDTHPLMVALYIQTLHPHMLYLEQTLVAALGHDLIEDTSVEISHIRNEFGDQVAASIQALTKKNSGISRSTEEYYSTLAKDPIASIVKAADRIHNIQTMVGTFSLEKQQEYLTETRNFVLPMLKIAREEYCPEQFFAYLNARQMLLTQMELIEKIHEATGITRD